MAEFVEMAQHGIAVPPPVSGKVVVSRLPAGESMILSEAPAVKLVLDGEEIHEIDGRSYVLRPGRMLLVDRGAPYRVTIRRGGTAGLCIYLPGKYACPPAPEEGFLARALLQTAETNPLGRLLAHSARLFHQERAPLDLDALLLRVRTALPAILAQAAGSMDRLGAVKASTRRELLNRLESARAYLHENKDRAVPLTELASVAAMSSFQLTRYFSLAFGDPPARYHRRVRLQQAAERLRRRDASITEIAFAAGYGELSAFTHAFAREFGCPPSAIAGAA